MYLIKRKGIKRVLSIVCTLALLITFMATDMINAAGLDIQTPLALSRSATESSIIINQQFTVNYKIEPQVVAAPQVTQPPKEFFLVIDTSGSMDWDLEGDDHAQYNEKRLYIAKQAAKSFLTKLEGEPNVKAGLIAYDNIANVECNLTSDFTTLKSKIDGLRAGGGTNIGDGLRVANFTLMGTSSNADKYVILLTDGEPTYHSCTTQSPTSYKMNDGITTIIKGGGSYATVEDKQYCYMVAEELLKANGIQSYMIAFTEGSNANVLSLIAQKADGTYKQALSASALNEVYTGISEEIINNFSLQDVTFEENYPAGLTVASAPDGLSTAGQKLSGKLPPIQYQLNETTNQYTAAPVEFSVTLQGDAAGNYILGSNNSSKVIYQDTQGNNQTEYFAALSVQVKDISAPISLSRSLNMNEAEVDQQVEISYMINPQPMQIVNTQGSKEREIVLVFDTSTSMERALDGGYVGYGEESREKIAKAAAVNFVTKLSETEGIEVALVSFSNKAEIRSGLTSDLNSIKTKINGLPTVSGTNIGDGLRRAYYVLENGSSTAEKFIVLLTDGEATQYTREGKYDYDYYFGDDYGYTSSSTEKGIQYSEKVVDTLINTKEYNNYYIAFSSRINKLSNLAVRAGGQYREALDALALGSIYNDISEVINSDFSVKNVLFTEELPADITAVEVPAGFSTSGQVITGSLGDIAYSYNAATGKYNANSKAFTIKVTAAAAGEYILGADDASEIAYVDINEATASQYFEELPLTVTDIPVIPEEPVEPEEPEEPVEPEEPEVPEVPEDPDPPYVPGDPNGPVPNIGTPDFDPTDTRKSGENTIVMVDITCTSDTAEFMLTDLNGVPYVIVRNGTVNEITGMLVSGEFEKLSIYETYEAILWYKLTDGSTGTTASKKLCDAIDIN